MTSASAPTASFTAEHAASTQEGLFARMMRLWLEHHQRMFELYAEH